MTSESVSKYLSWWGWQGSSQRRFRQMDNRLYRMYLWTVVLGPLFFANVFFGWPSVLFPLFGYSFLLWALWLAGVLWLITRLDVYDSVPVGIRWAIVFWSGGVANGAAGFLNAIRSGDTDRTFLNILRNAATEEILKFFCLILIFGISKSIFKRPLGAIICGFIAGIAFAFSESYKLSFSIINSTVQNGEDLSLFDLLFDWVYRRGILYSPWTHSTACALSALALWAIATKCQRSLQATVLLAISFCLASVGLHYGYNAISLGGGLIMGLNFPMAPETITFIPFVLLALWGVRREQLWFCEQGSQLQPHITEAESKQLMTRLCRAEVRARSKKQFGRRYAKAMSELQRLQLAYANVCFENDGVPGEPDKVGLRAAIADARTRGELHAKCKHR